MAVEANLRKRKHTGHDEDVVPKKMKKKIKTPKKQKSSENVENYSENDNNAEENEAETGEALEADSSFQEKPIKFTNDFKMLEFRTKLRGTNFITELRHFLYLTERKPRIIAKYIEKRGKPLELAEALERVNKANLIHMSYICDALQAVVMEIVTNQPVHMESAVSACRYFLKVHSNVIEQLLESPQVKHRRVALKLLTAIVCVDPQMGRQILAAFNILSDVRKIEQYLSHSKLEQNEPETVRKCYIHFVLAFMIDGNPLLVQNILDRSALIQALVFGLLYDDQVTVCLVLNTLKKYVLENTHISKTKKVHIFDLESCKCLVRLYDWLGTAVFFAKFATKKKTSSGGGNISRDQLDTLVNVEEKEIVAATAHEFLLTLLTSRKYGITFDATTNLRHKHNTIQGKIIGFLQKPWCCERKTELVIRILKACPDIARHTVRHFSNIVNPHRTGETEFTAAANFLAQIITTLHPDLLRVSLQQITLTDLSYWIKDICFPIETLVMLRSVSMLRHANVDCRLATHNLLLAMFTQYANFMRTAMEREKSKGGASTMRRFKFDIFNHIFSHFPSVDHIIHSLQITTGVAFSLPDDIVLKHLNVTLDLILIICKQNRSFVNRTGAVLDYLKLIRPLYAGEDDDNDNDDDDDGNNPNNTSSLKYHGDIKLELKTIKTILLLQPNALEPNQDIFAHVLKSFIKGFVYGSDDVKEECGKLLREIFMNTAIFDASILEIDLWLEALRFSDTTTVDVVTQVFVEVLKVTQAEVDFPSEIDVETNEANFNNLFENIDKGLSVQTYIESFAISKLLPLIFKGVELVDPLDKYIKLVCHLIFHYHSNPAYAAKLYEMKFSTPSNYMRRVLDTTDCEIPVLPNYCEQIPLLKELQRAILTDYKNGNFENIFGADQDEMSFEIEIERKKLKLLKFLKDERLLMIFIQQIIFLVSRLREKKQLVRSQAEFAANCITNFLYIAHELEQINNMDEISYTDEGVAVKKRRLISTLITYIYDIRFGCLNSLELCTNQTEENISYMHFITLITEYVSKLPDFTTYVKNFRLKIVKAIAISMENVDSIKQQVNPDFIKMLITFHLNIENCLEILELLCKNLTYSDFFVAIDDGFRRTFFFELLVCCLRRLTELQRAIQCEHIVKAITKFYVNFIKKVSGDLNLEDFEEVLHEFLTIVHQYIPCLDLKLFTTMFSERKLTKSSIKLACLLFERCDKFDEHFLNLLPEHIGKRELIYPLLEIAFNKNIQIDTTLLAKIYQEYRNGFMKTIEKPQKAGAIYKEHAECSVQLINRCMPITECMDFCKKRLQINDASELYQIRLIHAIYEKTWNALEKDAEPKTERSKVFINFLNLQLQLMGSDLKRQALNNEKLELFAYQCYSWFIKMAQKSSTDECNFESVTKSQNWLNFCKSCLKTGMQSVDSVENVDSENGLLLKLMAYLCDKLYVDHHHDDINKIEPNEAAQLFEMICTHSKYYDIVLSINPTQVKTAVLNLLFVLAKKSPTSALSHLEVSVILGAYHAKLSEADRYALALLQLYEQHNPQGLQNFRPFIWGESAISFYALNVSDLNERNRLTQQETTINLVMSLIDYQCCEFTIDNFPIWRKLNSHQQIPTVEFLDPNKKLLHSLGTNALERAIELNWSSVKTASDALPSSIDLRLCPKGDDVFLDCYDPAFFIPLMSTCFAPESCVHAGRPVQNGLLALCFAALSSHDKEMRQAAGAVQLRYRAHFEQSRFFERPLWIQAYENIQAGLAELSETWKSKHKKHSRDYKPSPRVPYIPTLFIAKTFNITNDPTNLLYKHLTMYLRLKNTFNFQCIPEFNIFFHSPEVEHHTFRQFIIDIIRKGIKGSSDLFLLVSTNTFKVLLSFYGGAMSTLETNLLILSALSTCTKIPASAKIMVEHIGILPWLRSVISTLEFYHFDVIEGVISILNNLWYAATATRADFYNYNYVASELYYLIVSLLPMLSPRISVMRFAKLMNVMQKTATTIKTNGNPSTLYKAISEPQLDKLIGCAEKHLGTTKVQYLRNLKTLGAVGAGSHYAYCVQQYNESNNEATLLTLYSLRAFIIDWWENTKGLSDI